MDPLVLGALVALVTIAVLFSGVSVAIGKIGAAPMRCASDITLNAPSDLGSRKPSGAQSKTAVRSSSSNPLS